MDDKQIDLKPTEYRTTRGVKGEPFFGAGWPIGAAALGTIAIGTLVHDAGIAAHIAGAIGGAIIGVVFQQFYR
jgi:hypothetical protein